MQNVLSALILCTCWLMPGMVQSQEIIGVGTKWDNSFKEWIIHTSDEDIRGEMDTRWRFREDFTEWDFRLDDIHASVEQKWEDDPNIWEVNCEGVVVTIRTLWSNDFSEWRLSDGTTQLTWKSRYRNVREEWELRDLRNGEFTMYTYWEGDPREWVVLDKLDEDVSFAMKVGLVFIALYNSTPKM